MAGSIKDFNRRIADTKRRLAAPSRSSSGGSSGSTNRAHEEEGLRELARINEKLGVKPEDLANPRSRAVSRRASRFVANETRIANAKTDTTTAATTAAQTQTALRSSERQRVSQAQTFEDKTRISRDIINERKGRAELSRINKERENILATGGSVSKETLRKAGTEEQVEITTTRGKGGRRIFEEKNLLTGESTIKTYDKKGRNVVQTGGVSIMGKVKKKR